MMRYLDYARRYGLPFFDANTGGGSGGGSQGGAQGQPAGGGGQGGNGNQQTIKTPFDDLPWDELDDATKKQLETVRDAHVATLQRTQKLEADLGTSDKLARRFQSELDRIKADLDKNNRPPEKDDYLESVKDQLVKSGFNKEEVDKMAPVFAGMFKNLLPTFKKEIGADLQPLAHTVLGREAESAFLHAKANDPLGMFAEPKVAERVWGMVEERTKAGEQTNHAIVSNLAKIAWADHQADLKANPNGPTQTQATQPTQMRTAMTYPGASNAPTFQTPADPNAPKTQLNSDTEAALATTFKHMGADTGVFPKRFQPAASRNRSNRR